MRVKGSGRRSSLNAFAFNSLAVTPGRHPDNGQVPPPPPHKTRKFDAVMMAAHNKSAAKCLPSQTLIQLTRSGDGFVYTFGQMFKDTFVLPMKKFGISKYFDRTYEHEERKNEAQKHLNDT